MSYYNNHCMCDDMCQACIQKSLPFSLLSDNELVYSLNAIDENFPYVYDFCEKFNFHPFEYSENKFLLNDQDIDPENNFLNDITIKCKYYNETEFNSSHRTKTTFMSQFSIIHINCRSLRKNFYNIQNYLKQLNIKFDVIAITETWLFSLEHDNFQIEGYNSNFVSRDEKRGGGVCIYVNNKFKYKVIDSLSLSTGINSNCSVDSLFIEIDNCKNKNIIIGCIYNPPNNNVMQFNEYLSSVLDKVSQKYCYICGDFNINLLNIEKHSLSNKFLDIFLENGYYPLITHPTRITSNTATLIDNIYTNVLNKNISSGLFITDISDHLPNFQITYELLVNKDTNDQHLKSHLIRDISDKRLSEFKHKISNIQWDNILN